MTEIIEEVVEKDKEDRYIIKLTYQDKSTDQLQVRCHKIDLDDMIKQIQRNREPFTHEILYVYKGDGI